ncbi:hypothetical protein [Deinococcus peraridilitoris]|uniref:Uncharacterized protein n=1 Tax=Deinococcus peraridilitoris (strain DSM 19664 / LMG 22246 / CIP 109416 / KR-200) TaxID=937777 RepID=K9ZZU4_DEIPD|nr:hypothetical protein [Deinococcus peraridilitoris]AFZ67101.1 hypothetical protein Deipe_1560 [Deinococcus peraridilitoris DSM 19664]
MTTTRHEQTTLPPADGLTPEEKARLAALEQVVGYGLRSFIEMAQALQEIQERRLYREQYVTFEHYCMKVWNFSRTWAYQIMQSKEAALLALDHGVPVPTERHARALIGVSAENLEIVASVVKAATGKENPTSADYQAVVETVRDLNHGAHIPHPATGEPVPFKDLRPEERTAAVTKAVKQGATDRKQFQGKDDTRPLDYAEQMRESGAQVGFFGGGEGWLFQVFDASKGEMLTGPWAKSIFEAVRAWRAKYEPDYQHPNTPTDQQGDRA